MDSGWGMCVRAIDDVLEANILWIVCLWRSGCCTHTAGTFEKHLGVYESIMADGPNITSSLYISNKHLTLARNLLFLFERLSQDIPSSLYHPVTSLRAAFMGHLNF